jgi:hypothetical protein
MTFLRGKRSYNGSGEEVSMAAPETRVMAEVPSYGEVMDRVKAEVLRLVGEKVLEFEGEQFCAWFGDPWHREKDARGIICCPRCADSPGFERRGKRGRCFHTRYGKVGSALLQVTCKDCGCTFSTFVGFFSEKGKRYSTYHKYERRQKGASSSRGRVLVADSIGVKTGKTKRGSSIKLAIKVTGREVKGCSRRSWSP